MNILLPFRKRGLSPDSRHKTENGISLTMVICLAGSSNLMPAELNRVSGGYGRVYKGVQESTGQSYAIKEMIPDEIFRREIKSMNILPRHVYISPRLLLTSLRKIYYTCLGTAIP